MDVETARGVTPQPLGIRRSRRERICASRKHLLYRESPRLLGFHRRSYPTASVPPPATVHNIPAAVFMELPIAYVGMTISDHECQATGCNGTSRSTP